MWLRITGNNDIPPRSDTLGASSGQPGYGSPACCEREAAPRRHSRSRRSRPARGFADLSNSRPWWELPLDAEQGYASLPADEHVTATDPGTPPGYGRPKA